jgi:hypothetical protein
MSIAKRYMSFAIDLYIAPNYYLHPAAAAAVYM